MKRFFLRCALALPLLLASLPAAAADDAATKQALAFFEVGAQAYDAGNFKAAIKAFDEAYRLAPRPGVTFSLAQAHRRQYGLDRKPDDLRAAVKHYREYLGKVETGGRREEVLQALDYLEPLAEKLGNTPDPGAKAAPKVEPQTSLMIMTRVKGAMISVDGGKPATTPVVAEVKPGKHTVRVTADGYFPDEREVPASAGITTPVDVPLQEMPGLVEIDAPSGAEVSVDGRPRGAAPFAKPLDVQAGRHLVTVTRNGYRVHAEEIDLARGEKKAVHAPLARTAQRKASFVLMGAGAGGLIAGGVLAALAVGKQHEAQDIGNQASGTGCPPLQAGCTLAAYDDARNARDDLRRWAGVAAGGGLALGVGGLLLYAFDQPSVGASSVRVDDKAKAPVPAPTPTSLPMELSALPLVGPGLYGAALGGRF
jgi:tetratricopeptide (TPR) repeat protein